MSKCKKIGVTIGAIVVVGAVVAGGWAYNTLNTQRSSVADDKVALADFHSDDKDAITRGEYVMRMGDCAACHTKGQGDFAGGYKIETPFGTLVSSNITPDADTGIGKMTERDFFNAVRQGIGSHGLLYPAMPYTAYAKLSDADMHDLWAYMSTIKPVKNDIDENGGMSFPFNIRLAMAGWDMLFFDNNGFEPDTSKDEAWNRGKYLVDGPGHCSACHSPRNLLSAEKSDEYLWGAPLEGYHAADLTSNDAVGLGQHSPEEIAEYLRTGINSLGAAGGPMAEAVEHSLQYMTEDDAMAMATYLKSVPASTNKAAEPMDLGDAKSALADTYEVNCSACHGLDGEGIDGMIPAFASNTGFQSDDAASMIHAMLVGARAPYTQYRQTAAGMPSFAWKFNDQQIADILNYVRNSWGNGAKPVSVDQVTEMRKELDAAQPRRAN
ncbi:c-type cytochrome [Thioclava sp. GXIMD2076]|uniref:C-type cytochrome n=1 Tax=Thioclava kandeliae TaxID=3070818 RepID=A0ABV1SKU1_9RHOB